MTTTTPLHNDPTVATIQAIMAEMNDTHFERSEIIQSIFTGAISQQHILLVGAPGSGKSMVCRDFASRIDGSTFMELALDESTTKDEILGGPDLKSLVEEGKTRRITDGMLPTVHYAFLDEIFNGNAPALHSIMPLLNERIFHNNGKPVPIPLRSAVMGTNKLNADSEVSAAWDRMHLRHQVTYVLDRDKLRALLNAAVLRQVSDYVKPVFTTISLADLDAAHDKAMQLPVSDQAGETFLDLHEELARNGIIVSTRRLVEGRKAVMASAYLAGHSEVKIGDLSVLRHMFWNRQEEVSTVKNIILAACNPGEKAALDFLEQLDALKAEYQTASALDTIKRDTAAADIFRKAQWLIDKATPLRETALAAGAGTQRIDDLVGGSNALRRKIASEVFQVDDVAQLDNLPKSRRR